MISKPLSLMKSCRLDLLRFPVSAATFPVISLDLGPFEEQFRAYNNSAARHVEVCVKVHVDHRVSLIARDERVTRLMHDPDFIEPKPPL
jgi:hypothetical protein